MTKHHLIPRTRHKNKKTKRDFTRDQLHESIKICRACHNQIHAVFKEKELEREYNRVSAIKSHPEIKKYIDWIKDKPESLRTGVRRSKN